MIPPSWKLYLDIAGGVIFCVLVFLMVKHLESIGADRVRAADAMARMQEHTKMLETQSQWQATADKAEAQRDATQKQLDAFRTANPTGHVFMCKPQGKQPTGLPDVTGSYGANVGPGSGPAAVSEVPPGAEGIDIGPGLDALVHAAGTLGGLYRQYQQQPEAKPVK